MNLLEKLKPGALELLNKEAIKYPRSTEQLKQRLFDLNFWSDLKISDAYTLCQLNGSFGISELASMFEE